MRANKILWQNGMGVLIENSALVLCCDYRMHSFVVMGSCVASCYAIRQALNAKVQIEQWWPVVHQTSIALCVCFPVYPLKNSQAMFPINVFTITK